MESHHGQARRAKIQNAPGIHASSNVSILGECNALWAEPEQKVSASYVHGGVCEGM